MSIKKIREELYLTPTSQSDSQLQRHLDNASRKVEGVIGDVKFYLACYDLVSKIGSEREMEFYKKKVLAKLEIV